MNSYASAPHHASTEPVTGTINLTIADPFDCLPPRARRQHGKFHVRPFWSPTASAEIGIVSLQPPQWKLESVQAIEPVHHVTFRRKQSTFSFLSRKNGMTQTGESPWELLRAHELEVDPTIVDFQLGALRINWNTEDGHRHYTLDNVAVDVDGQVLAEEIKASASYFLDPEYSVLMKRSAASLEQVGIKFNKVDADLLRNNRRRRFNVAAAFDDRYAAFTATQLDTVRSALEHDKAGVPLGRLTEALSLPSRAARQVVNAMMCMRHVAYDLNLPIGPDTQIFPALKVKKHLPDIRALQR